MAVATPGVSSGRVGAWALSEMRVQDLPQVLEIERGCFGNPWTSALFLQELRIPFSRIVVIRPIDNVEEPIVGYLCRWFVADEVHILNVAVHPAQRRRGIGGVLMREALREARERGAEAVTLEVRRSNAGARRLYEALHFEEVGVRRCYYGRDEDALIMRLALRHA
jgi:ribosomal-protein-alanine N-acetyltransferase